MFFYWRIGNTNFALCFLQGHYRFAQAYFELGFLEKAVAVNSFAQKCCSSTLNLLCQAVVFKRGFWNFFQFINFVNHSPLLSHTWVLYIFMSSNVYSFVVFVQQKWKNQLRRTEPIAVTPREKKLLIAVTNTSKVRTRHHWLLWAQL